MTSAVLGDDQRQLLKCKTMRREWVANWSSTLLDRPRLRRAATALPPIDATTFAVFEDELGSFLREQEDEFVSGANLISTLPD